MMESRSSSLCTLSSKLKRRKKKATTITMTISWTKILHWNSAIDRARRTSCMTPVVDLESVRVNKRSAISSQSVQVANLSWLECSERQAKKVVLLGSPISLQRVCPMIAGCARSALTYLLMQLRHLAAITYSANDAYCKHQIVRCAVSALLTDLNQTYRSED